MFYEKKEKNGQRRYKYNCLRKGQLLFCKNKLHSDSAKKFSETDIIKLLEFFFIDNIFVMFGGRVFQQLVIMPMGTNRAPLLAHLYFYFNY